VFRGARTDFSEHYTYSLILLLLCLNFSFEQILQCYQDQIELQRRYCLSRFVIAGFRREVADSCVEIGTIRCEMVGNYPYSLRKSEKLTLLATKM